jgi:hypothetical protein
VISITSKVIDLVRIDAAIARPSYIKEIIMTLGFTKRVFLADATVCALTFLACIFATSMLMADTGLTSTVVVAGGWICLGAAMLWGCLGTRAVPPVALCWLAITLNIGWIIGSLAVFELSFATLTSYGRLLLPLQAAGVLGFVIFQIMGTRQIARSNAATVAA